MTFDEALEKAQAMQQAGHAEHEGIEIIWYGINTPHQLVSYFLVEYENGQPTYIQEVGTETSWTRA